MILRTKGEYFGSEKSVLNVNGIDLSEYNYLEKTTEWHYHETPYLMYVLQGNMYDVNKKRKTECPSGSLLFLNWQDQHLNTKETEQARGFHIGFDKEWFSKISLGKSLWEGSQLLEHPDLHRLVGKIYLEFWKRDEFSGLIIESLLMQLCDSLERNLTDDVTRFPDWVGEMQSILYEEKQEISLTDLAEKLQIHPVHLSRSIPKYFDSTFGQILRKQKIKRAQSLLFDFDLSLTEITYICGFSDQSHFIRTFKSYFKMTPKQFRNRIRV